MDRRVALATAVAILIVAPAGGSTATSESVEDKVVEGHTTYATIENEVDEARTVSVIGDVRCHVEVLEVKVTVPPSVEEVDADCGADVQVLGTVLGAPDPTGRDLEPTGRTFEAVGPQGGSWTTTELAYEAGGETWRAWSVPVEEPRLDPGSGEEYRFVAAVPTDAGEQVRLRTASGR